MQTDLHNPRSSIWCYHECLNVPFPHVSNKGITWNMKLLSHYPSPSPSILLPTDITPVLPKFSFPESVIQALSPFATRPNQSHLLHQLLAERTQDGPKRRCDGVHQLAGSIKPLDQKDLLCILGAGRWSIELHFRFHQKLQTSEILRSLMRL